MKRFFASVLALLMLAQLAIPAVAEEEYSLGCFHFDVPAGWRLDKSADNQYAFETEAGALDVRLLDLSDLVISWDFIDLVGQDVMDKSTVEAFTSGMSERGIYDEFESLVSPRNIQGFSCWIDLTVTKGYCVYLVYGTDMLLISSLSGSRQSMIREADQLLERVVARRPGQEEYVLGNFRIPCPVGWTLSDQTEGEELVFQLEDGEVSLGLVYDEELADITPEDYIEVMLEVLDEAEATDIETGTTAQGLPFVAFCMKDDEDAKIASLPQGDQLLYIFATEDTLYQASHELLNAIYYR